MKTQQKPQLSAVSRDKGDVHPPTAARAEFIAEATKQAARHLKSLDAVGKRAAESLKSIRYPTLAINAAMENLRNSGMSRVIDDLKKQQQSWDHLFDSPAIRVAQQMIKEQAKRPGNFMPMESLEVRYLASPQHQHPLHPRDADRFDRIEKHMLELQIAKIAALPMEKTTNDESDFAFHDKGLFLSHKGRRLAPLTVLEIILCHEIFTETSGYRFRTMELEDTVYPGDYAEGNHIKDRLKKLVSRLNAKISTQTGVKKLLLYSADFVTRQG